MERFAIILIIMRHTQAFFDYPGDVVGTMILYNSKISHKKDFFWGFGKLLYIESVWLLYFKLKPVFYPFRPCWTDRRTVVNYGTPSRHNTNQGLND